MKINWQKYISHPLQGILAHSLYFLMGLVPLDIASAIGGWLGRTLGPTAKVSKVARDNLKQAFPNKTDQEIENIIKDMFDNLGRVAFEFPHVPLMNVYHDPERFEIVGTQYLDQLAGDGKCGLLFSAHMANWEISTVAAVKHEPPFPLHLIFRAPDNPWVKRLFESRISSEHCSLIPKGVSGARKSLQVLRNGDHIAMLVDQKMNDGIAVPFFGREAMTAPAIAQFAVKFDCPIVPVQIIRTKGARFKLVVHPPLVLPHTEDRQDDVYQIMCTINGMLENWIIENPGQWLWAHRRWPKK